MTVNAIGTDQYRVLFGLWRIAGYRPLGVYGIVDAITICEHVVARVNKIIFAIAFKHARPLGPPAVHAGVKVDIGSKRGVCRHLVAFNARMVGMIKIPLAIVVDKDATINLLFQVLGHHLERARGAVAGKHIVAITIGRRHHIESAIPVFHLGGIAINGNGVVAHHNGVRPIDEVARRPAQQTFCGRAAIQIIHATILYHLWVAHIITLLPRHHHRVLPALGIDAYCWQEHEEAGYKILVYFHLLYLFCLYKGFTACK